VTTYIKDLIDLPERVHGGDFVLKLTEGVEHPDETLRHYVVTPELARNFDDALDFIKGAVQSNSSKAAYLHGSFGSGKSHFMAVLHLLLQQHPAAKAKEGLAETVTRHNGWLEGKRFLLVPYHMIGQPNMEAAVLGGYVRRVLALHPDAPIPGVYKAEGLFRDAAALRETLGDEAFFERLNRAAGSGSGGWGELESAWDADSFEAALDAPPGADERSRLIGALVEEFFRSYKEVARGSEEAYVPLDDGLAIISRHAQALGYDALVLFLDELILWLATHAADQRFLNTEGPKVSKLVEAERADRPIPIVSFVARQRDLRELVGDSITGAEQLGFADVLRWWEARFDTITLDDRNLPEIAARRVLRPKSEAARQQIEQAWQQTERIREEVMGVLLTPNADRGVFRKVYPFSPALVETLIAVSSVLQRERTALKVMLQLLVSQRDTLQLGQIVPAGDLFDVIAEGDEPFSEGMRIHFENAKRLYRQKLLPMLEKEHGLTAEEAKALPWDDARAQAFRAGDRLIKTLLLAALVPQVDALKALNSARLAALNHGSITAPIPGRESKEVLRRVRAWASQVGEIKVGEEADPSIALQLSGVDTEGILANAQAIDNPGNRRRKVRELLFEQLGIADTSDLFLEHEVPWRGTSRRFQVIFGNVRELTSESLAAKGDGRKAVIDFPFDEPGHSSAEDVARLDEFRAQGTASRTLVWIPAFLSAAAQKDLGLLVKLDDILKSDDTFRRHSSHLSDIDRAQARSLLQNQQSSLRQRVIRYLEGAYGVDTALPGSVDESHSVAAPFQSLDPSFTPQPPVGANLKQAFEHLLAQMLESQFPAHPEFGQEIKPSALRKVQDEVARAVQDPDGRIAVDKPLRPLMLQIAVPLKLGEMGDTHFALGRHWLSHFNRQVQGAMTVGKLRAALDVPRPMGLPLIAQNLVILVYADQANRSFYLHGGPYQPKLDSLPDELELREQSLPSPEDWEAAVQRAGKIFGIAASPLRNASNVSDLAGKLGTAAQGAQEACQVVADRLEGLCEDWDIAPAACARQQTARAVLTLLQGLAARTDAKARIEALAQAKLATSLDAMGTGFRKAAAVQSAIAATKWDLLAAATSLTDDRQAAAQGIRTQLVEALSHDEYAIALASRLQKLESDAVRLLAPARPTAPTAPVAQTSPLPSSKPVVVPDVVVVDTADQHGLDASAAQAKLKDLADRLAADPSLQIDLSWTLYRQQGAK
jgi:hypothetical protein